MQKTYNRINWENYPSETTPINEDNLNAMDSAINEIDNRVINFYTTKANVTDVLTMISDVSYNEASGIFTFTRKNGSVFTLDTKLEKLAINWIYDSINEVLIITLDDGTKQEVPLSALINEYDFLDSDTIAFEVDIDGKVSAIVKEGSIEEKHLQPNYLADVKAESSKAETQANSAEQSAKEAKEYAEAAAESASKAEALTGPVVSGIKGSAESNFRTGQVTISPEDLGLGDVLDNMLKAHTLVPKTYMGVTADTVQNFFKGAAKFAIAQGIQLHETMHLQGSWASNDYFTILCTWQVSGDIMMLGWRSLGNVYFANYSINNDNISRFFELADLNDLSKYLPLAGGTLTGALYMANHIMPTADNTRLLGGADFAWANVCALIHSLYRNGQNYGSMSVSTEGTEGTQGYARLMLGNNIPTGTAGNASSFIWMYGKGTGSVQIHPHGEIPDGTVRQVYLPNANGTLALTSDITALNTLTTAEQSVVTYFIETVFSVMSTTQSVSTSFFQKDGVPYAWHGVYQQSNYASFILHGYNIRTIHMQLNNGVWTYNAMDNK